MKQGRTFRHGVALMAGALLLITGIIWHGAMTAASATPPPPPKKVVLGKVESGLIHIDEVSGFHESEMPPAVFPHDKHTRNLAKRGMDCQVCHQGMRPGQSADDEMTGTARGKDAWPPSEPFRVLPAGADTNPTRLQEAFHESCIGCHVRLDKGPQVAQCRECHVERPIPDQRPVRMDKSLHARHIASADVVAPENRLIMPREHADTLGNCAACHHSYDPQMQALFWEPGQEQACSVCHGPQPGGNTAYPIPDAPVLPASTPSLQDAMHASCVGCHAARALQARANATGDEAPKPGNSSGKMKEKRPAKALPAVEGTGPDTCAGCHSKIAQDALAEARDTAATPRLMRGQPDVTIILPLGAPRTPEPGQSKTPLTPGMQPVLFNHRAHEAVTDSCTVCHHARLEQGGCTTCHTVPGSPAGGNLPLASAMHKPDATQSCVGCHQIQTQKPECAGCHGVLRPMNPSSCTTCHAEIPGLSLMPANADAQVASPPPNVLQALAVQALDARAPRAVPLDPESVPETVRISLLADEYQPAVFPHRAVYKKLLEGMDGNTLASAFHTQPLSTCAACHHKTPVAELATPPSCVSCHAADEAGAAATGRPSLKIAYHQQCMTCHTRMNIQPAATDCAACHATPNGKPGRK